MIRVCLRVAVRNLRKYRAFSLINVAGLSVGITCCIAILLYVQDELSYDRFNKNADQTYRIYLRGLVNNHEVNSAMSSTPIGPALKHDLPEVVSYTRVRSFSVPVIRYKDKAFSENKFFWVDSTFFDVFTTKFIEGNPKTALTQPNTVVITESVAKKYFGNGIAMGKILNADNRRDYVVTGVVEGFPRDSHFHFDFLGSLTTYDDSRNTFWLSCNYYTYILLRKGADPIKSQRGLGDEFRKYGSPQLKQSMGISLDQFEAAGNRFGFFLQPLTSIHLHSHLDGELEANGDVSYVYIFSAIAVAVLLIACINFVNLATARSEKRAKEVGIRKTLGSTRSQLVAQFIGESVLLSMLAVMLAVGLVELLLPVFNDIAGKEMSLNVFGDFSTIPLLLCFAIFAGFIAGSYPAFFLSSYEPVQVLRSGTKIEGRRTFIRGSLVVFQFAISIVLLIGTFVIYDQLRYIQNKNLGFNKEQVIVINKANDLGNRLDTFEQEILGDSRVISVSNSTAIPGNQQGAAAFWVEGTSSQQMQGMRFMWSDYDFLKTYQLNLEAGRFFSKNHPSDTAAAIVNQAAAEVFGIKDLVGKYLVTPGSSQSSAQKYKVVGVIRDFNFESLHEVVQPLIIGLLPAGQAGNFESVRIAPYDYSSTISFLENTWKKHAGGEAFDYNFLDQNLTRLYAAEQRTSKLAATFSILAIFVACLGLLGLAAFVTEQRTKEIGIRKVLGASVPEITIMLSREFTNWVLVANVIAWPLGYYIMTNWLKDFAYRVDIGLWTFVASGAAALVIALLTVSSHAIKIATANPVDSLRHE